MDNKAQAAAAPVPVPRVRKYLVRSVVDAAFKAPGDVVEGVVTELGKLPKEMQERRFMVVDTGESMYRVYETWDLGPIFKAAKVGHHVSITYLETKSIKGNKSVKRYDGKLWSE